MLKDESVKIEEPLVFVMSRRLGSFNRKLMGSEVNSFKSEAGNSAGRQIEVYAWYYSWRRSLECNISRQLNAIPFAKSGAGSEGSNFVGCVNAL